MTKKRTHRLSLWNRHSWDSPQEILRAVEGLTGEVSTVTPANAESPPMANVNSTAPTATIDEAGSSSPVKIQPDLSSTIPLDPVDPISELPLAEPDSTSSPQQRSAPILSKDPCFKSEIDNQFEIVGWSNRRSEPMDQATASSNEAEAKPVEQASHPPMSTRGVEDSHHHFTDSKVVKMNRNTTWDSSGLKRVYDFRSLSEVAHQITSSTNFVTGVVPYEEARRVRLTLNSEGVIEGICAGEVGGFRQEAVCRKNPNSKMAPDTEVMLSITHQPDGFYA